MKLIVTILIGMSLAFSIHAKTAQPTIYDDGRSCPANCDTHVVFHQSMNGTKHAHLPGTKKEECKKDEDCEVCFDHKRKQCVTTKYRGGGPPKHKFDFTNSFYIEKCESADLPDALKRKCSSLKSRSRELDGKINCINNREHGLCLKIMESATSAKEMDTLNYLECKRVGQDQYNQGRIVSEQRIIGCAYEKEKNGGPNSNGTTWYKLLPGACREDDFVGKYGLDCCSGTTFTDASLSGCRGFYPQP